MSTGHWTYDKGQSKGKGKGDGKDSDIAEDTEEKGKGDGKGIDRGEDSDVAGGTSFQCKRQLLAPWRHEAVAKVLQVSLNAAVVIITKNLKT